MTNQKLTLALSPEAKTALSAFAIAKGLGKFHEAKRLKRRYEAKLESDRYELELQRSRERSRQLQIEQERFELEEERRLNEEALADSYEQFPTGKVPVWRLIRHTDKLMEQMLWRTYCSGSNDNKRNRGGKPRRSW